jgi:hypothetical protein
VTSLPLPQETRPDANNIQIDEEQEGENKWVNHERH